MKLVRLPALCFTLLCLVSSGETLKEIKTEGPRPLDEALEQIEDHFATPLFYEEIPHENPSDLVSGSEIGANRCVYSIRSRKLDVTIVEPSTIESSVNDTISAYSAQGSPGTYAPVPFSNQLAVLPKIMTNAVGLQVTTSLCWKLTSAFPRKLEAEPTLLRQS